MGAGTSDKARRDKVRAGTPKWYEAALNALIPKAVLIADRACKRLYGDDETKWDRWYWDRTYFAAMDSLAEQEGLRKKRYDS